MKTRTIVGTLLSCAALGGCAFPTQVTRMAMDQNDFVAQTTNNQTLINILRAREREPLHFTSFGTISGKVSLEATGEISATSADNTLGRTFDANDKKTGSTRGASTLGASAQASASVTTGTDFQLAVNATDEFYKGIMGPVNESVIVHYIEDGWPKDLLSNLFIGKIDFYVTVHNRDRAACKTIIPHSSDSKEREECSDTGKDYPLLSVRNSPDSKQESELFARIVRCRVLNTGSPQNEPESVTFPSISDLSNVSDDSLSKITDSTKFKDRYKIDLSKNTPTLTMSININRDKIIDSSKDSDVNYNNINKESDQQCGSARIVLQDALFRLDALSKIYNNTSTNDYAAFSESMESTTEGRIIDSEREKSDRIRYISTKIFDDYKITANKDSKNLDQTHRYCLKNSTYSENKTFDDTLSDFTNILTQREIITNSNPYAPSIKTTSNGSRAIINSSEAKQDYKSQSDIKSLILKKYFNYYTKKDHDFDLKIVLTLRSVESIIYYLGEYVRTGNGSCISGDRKEPVPILMISETKPTAGDKVFAQARFEEKNYWVPPTGQEVKAPAGRSSQVISLVQQLLNLYRSSKDLPSVQTVRVTN